MNHIDYCICDPERGLEIFNFMMKTEIERQLAVEEVEFLRKKIEVLERDRLEKEELRRMLRELEDTVDKIVNS